MGQKWATYQVNCASKQGLPLGGGRILGRGLSGVFGFPGKCDVAWASQEKPCLVKLQFECR